MRDDSLDRTPGMTDRPRGGLAALCITQTTSWGLLYYSLPVAVDPISQDTGWSHTTITAALSLGLVISAVAGLRVGKILDRQGPRQVMTFGSLMGTLGLVLVAWSPNLPMFFLAWAVIGLAQSAVLYPPAFVVITRWYGPQRVGPLTTLTLVAGLASTIFAPIVAYLIDQTGWRLSYVIFASILAAITVPLHARFLNSTWTPNPDPNPTTTETTSAKPDTVTRTPRFIILQIVMAVATFTLLAVTINLIPLLMERDMTYSMAALTLGLVGTGQVLGRLGYAPLDRLTTARHRTGIILTAGALALWALAVLPGPHWLLIIVAILAGSARGCHTLLQATAVSDRWGTTNFGHHNAVFTAPMTALGALAPVAGPALANLLGGYPVMALVMAALLTIVTSLTPRT